MSTPRLRLIQHLGLATSHACRTDPDWIRECRAELARALSELSRAAGEDRDPLLNAIERVIAGEG